MKNLIGISGKIGAGKDTIGLIIKNLTTPGNNAVTLPEYFAKKWEGERSAFKIKKFASKLKEIVSLLTGISVDDLEDIDVKNSTLPNGWNEFEFATGEQLERTYDNEGGREYAKTMGWKRLHEKDEATSPWQREVTKMKTYRDMLQRLGTEVMRDNLHKNVWVNALFADYRPLDPENSQSMLSAIDYTNCKFPKWIITDVRFPNEAKAISLRKGILIRVNRDVMHKDSFDFKADLPHLSRVPQHPSETALDDYKFDYVIDNNGTITELVQKVKHILAQEKII